ncbi:MAG TPA: family 16 glycosylhydrolase, partial [Chitinophagales bacterium]|nr:family 16 glycosylhydrolase [Chitinophagales bacterium]
MKKHFLLSMVVMLLLWQPGFGQALLDKSGWSIQFQDEFNYSNNATLWSNWNWYDPYTDPATNLCGKEFCGQNQKYVQANTYVDGSGAVRIKTVDLSASMPVCGPTNSATAKYSQGAIWSKYMDNTYCSNGVGGFLYGMFEARIKMGKGAAKYGAFWLTGANAWPPEYDVFEFNGNTPNQFFSTPHWVSTNYQLASFNCSSSITIGTGVKSLTLPTNWSIQPGQQIVIVRDNSNWMAATVNSYSPSTGACVATVSSSPGGCTTWAGLGNSWDNVTCTYSGSGTYNSWRVDCRRGDCSCSTVYDKPTPGRLDEEYHTYTFVWTPSSVAWFFDGKEMRTDNYPDRIGTDCNWRKMVFGIGMGVNCPGALTSDEMYVDYVRVYKPTVSNVWNYKQYSSQVIDRTQHLLNVSEPANTAQSK